MECSDAGPVPPPAGPTGPDDVRRIDEQQRWTRSRIETPTGQRPYRRLSGVSETIVGGGDGTFGMGLPLALRDGTLFGLDRLAGGTVRAPSQVRKRRARFIADRRHGPVGWLS
jgi:hypothetical protein